MDNLFGGLIADKSSKLSGVGQSPIAIGDMGGSMGRIHAKFNLPTEISASEVIKQEKEIGRVEAEMELAKTIAKNQEQLLNKAIDLHNINTQWATTKMKADIKLREMQQGHATEVARYQLGASTTQAYTDGYTEAYQMSAEIFQ